MTSHDYDDQPWAYTQKVHQMDAAAITAFGQYVVIPITTAALFIAMLYFGTRK